MPEEWTGRERDRERKSFPASTAAAAAAGLRIKRGSMYWQCPCIWSGSMCRGSCVPVQEKVHRESVRRSVIAVSVSTPVGLLAGISASAA